MVFGIVSLVVFIIGFIIIVAYFLLQMHKVDRIIQQTWVSVLLVLLSTFYILLGFFVIDCLIHQNYTPGVHDFVKLYGMFSQTNSAYSSEPTEPEPFYMILSFIGALTFSGLMISAFTNMYSQRIFRIRQGLVNYRFSEHIVIIGGNSSLLTIINSTLITNESFSKEKPKNKNNIPRILIVSSKRPSELSYIKDNVRKEVWDKLYFYCNNILLPVTSGGISNHFLNKSRVSRADKIYIIGDKEPGMGDIDTLSILDNLANFYTLSNMNEDTGTKDCYVAYSNLEMLITSMRDYESKKYGDFLKHIRIMPYDFHLSLASKVWGASRSMNASYHPLAPDTDGNCHILISGFNSMAQAMLKMAILKCHFGHNRHTYIKVIHSPEQNTQANLFNTDYHLSSLRDISIEFEESNRIDRINSYVDYLDHTKSPTIVLCHESTDINIRLSYAIKKIAPVSDILIYSSTPLLLGLANDNTGKRRSDLSPFGNLNQSLCPDFLYRDTIVLYLIRDLLKENPDACDLAELSNEEIILLFDKAKQRFFSFSFDNVTWRIMAIVESFLNFTDEACVKIDDDESIENQIISAIVLSGYIVDRKLAGEIDKESAYSKKIVALSDLNVNLIRAMTDTFHTFKKKYNGFTDY